MPGFNFLPLPRSSIPIGAIWIQHIGPNDSGVTKENLVTDTSFSGFKISDADSAALTIRFASFLGLSAKQVKDMRLELDGLQSNKYGLQKCAFFRFILDYVFSGICIANVQ